MNFFNTSAARFANAKIQRAALAVMLCLGLVACGTKPKNLKTDQPFPAAYPPSETASPPQSNPPAQAPPGK